jgi:hypothetical protein
MRFIKMRVTWQTLPNLSKPFKTSQHHDLWHLRPSSINWFHLIQKLQFAFTHHFLKTSASPL